jgi:hypothetical protein
MKIFNFQARSRRWPASSRSLLAACFIAAVLGGCAQLGPQVLSTGRPLYNTAVQETDSQQLLLNVVRQRYNDPILFLEVTSISSGFSREVSGNLLGSIFNSGKNDLAGTVGGTFNENPFIFYAPNTGEKFVRQMLTPLDLRTVALILQAGWSIERVLQIVGVSVNQLHNSPVGDEARTGYRKYLQVVSSLRDLQRDGRLIVGVEPGEDGGEASLALMITPDAVDSEPYRLVCESVSVSCDGQPLRLRQAFGNSSDGKTMALATRSLFSSLYVLAEGVDVPAEDAANGFAPHRPRTEGGPFDLHNPRGQLFHVLTSAEEPRNAAIKVFYRDSWFYIADNDMDSKVTFALLSMLVTLQAGDTTKITPLITLPAM